MNLDEMRVIDACGSVEDVHRAIRDWVKQDSAQRALLQGGGDHPLKLILAIVQEKDSRRLMEALVAAEFQATMLASTGGFFREGNSTILIGTDEDRVDAALAVIQKT